MTDTVSPAVEAAKEIAGRNSGDGTFTHKGVKVRIVPVSATLIDEVTSRVKDPKVPIWHNPDKDRDEENPNDPEYLRGLQEAEHQRGIAAMDAMIMFGVELPEGMPEDQTWLKKLRVMEKRGQVDLSIYDVEDPIDVEFLYKRLWLTDADLLAKVSKKSGISGEEIDQASKSFPGDA